MKLHSIKVEISTFLAVLFLLIAPSLLTILSAKDSILFTSWEFPYVQLCLFIIALMLFIFYNDNNERPKLLRFPILIIVGSLLAVALLIKSVSVYISPEETEKIALPNSVITWIYCILNFAFAAFYEEVIYRFYFGDSLAYLLSLRFKWKCLPLICEVICALVFAFSHLYLGVLAVVNALIGHVILRVCYKKNKCLLPCAIAHFFYNLISLVLM